jgi:hypothetical protein
MEMEALHTDLQLGCSTENLSSSGVYDMRDLARDLQEGSLVHDHPVLPMHDGRSSTSTQGATPQSPAVLQDEQFVTGAHYCLIPGRLFFTAHPDEDYTIREIGSNRRTFYFSSLLPGELPLIPATVQNTCVLTFLYALQRSIFHIAPIGGLSRFRSLLNFAGMLVSYLPCMSQPSVVDADIM